MDVQFNEPEYAATPVAQTPKRGPLMRFLIARGWAKDEKGAERILLYVIVVVIVITGMVLATQVRFSSAPPPADPTIDTL